MCRYSRCGRLERISIRILQTRCGASANVGESFHKFHLLMLKVLFSEFRKICAGMLAEGGNGLGRHDVRVLESR